MPSNSETILSTQTHTGDSSVQTLTGDAYKGDGYYGRSDGFHTIQYTVTGFRGAIEIQATLAVDPSEDDWFQVSYATLVVDGDDTYSNVANFVGNYVWIRAKLSNWTDGTVNSIRLNH
jgi:hypothetical protein